MRLPGVLRFSAVSAFGACLLHRNHHIRGLDDNGGSHTGLETEFVYSNGTTVTANGIYQYPYNPIQYTPSDYPASFLHARIEGQFIYANPTGNTTVNLHAYDGGSFCEIRGTAVFAPNPPGPPAPPVNK